MEVKGFDNYLIYSDGRVLNKNTQRLLKHIHNKKNEYKFVRLSKNGKVKNLKVHRLLAQHYISNPNNLPIVDHIDRDKLNNSLNNLRWVDFVGNRQNCNKAKSNTSGHTYISYYSKCNLWVYAKRINHKRVRRCFKTKIEALCFKFIQLLKHSVYKKNY